jgi:hypothetical protein
MLHYEKEFGLSEQACFYVYIVLSLESDTHLQFCQLVKDLKLLIPKYRTTRKCQSVPDVIETTFPSIRKILNTAIRKYIAINIGGMTLIQTLIKLKDAMR